MRSLAIGGLRLLGWFVENFSTAKSTLKIVLVTLEGGVGGVLVIDNVIFNGASLICWKPGPCFRSRCIISILASFCF